MARLGVTPELVLDLARRHTDDREVLEALREHGIPPARDAWFDAVAVEDELNVVLVELAPGRAGDESVAGSAQIWVVQAGAATFFLGRLQARIVRAGEVVRIPAGVPWRVENRGDGVFRAVAVAPAATR
jgi:quercetin dioxygenase-like cupin family protein